MPNEVRRGDEPRFAHNVRPRVIIKYDDSVTIPELPSEALDGSLLTPGWKDFRSRFPGLRNRRLLRQPINSIRRVGKQVALRDPFYAKRKLDNYVVLELPEGTSAEEVRDFARREHLGRAIEFAYVTSPPVPPPGSYPPRTAEGAMQPYLESAGRGGIDARYAWGYRGGGGDGSEQTLYDVEWGWAKAHRDLPTSASNIIGGCSYSYFHHGTAVLGIVAAKPDGAGCIGIAPGLKGIRCASSWRNSTGTDFDIADAIWDVIDEVFTQGVPGAVLLLEEQTDFHGRTKVPAESIPAVFEMVRVATLLGITVVAAAGNGGVDLDRFSDELGREFMNPDSPDYVDSGAILVGAASSQAPHTPLGVSNHGKRVNCFGWGDGVYSPTTNAYGSTSSSYGCVIDSTSSAAAIVAGAALVVQGLATAARGSAHDPGRLRSILGDVMRGTRSKAFLADGIGVMPNLRRIIDDRVF